MPGAGVLPFCIQSGEVYFLFHRTFVGKKVGYLIDFGGGMSKSDNSNYDLAAAREFSEETGGFFFTENEEESIKILENCTSEVSLQNSEPVKQGTAKALQHIQHLRNNDPKKIWILKKIIWNYHLYLFEIPYKDLKSLNQLYKNLSKHFKEREFLWIKSSDILEKKTLPLFDRVSSFSEINEIFATIRKTCEKKE